MKTKHKIVFAKIIFFLLSIIRKKNLPKEIYASWNLQNNKNVHKKHFGSLKKTSNAKSLKLDDYILIKKIKKIDFIKLDVDGHELDVLKSGYKFLKSKKVPIIFEVAPYLYKEYGYTHKDLINLFIRYHINVHGVQVFVYGLKTLIH